MALSNITDPARAASSLATALRHRLGATDVNVYEVRIPPSSGMSNETLLFDAAWSDGGVDHKRELVARVAPAGPAVYMRYNLPLEALVLQSLSVNTSIPVPEVLFVEDDPTLLGASFIVMERIAGQVPADDPPFAAAGWVLDLTPQHRRRMAEESARRLAELHAVDWRGIGLEALGDHPEAGLEGQLDFWQRSFDWAREGRANFVISTGLTWLTDNRVPDPPETVLLWGDARLGNTIFAPDGTPVALLDWEMTCVGSADSDVAWWLFMFEHFTSGIGLPAPEGFPDRQEFVAMYERFSGQKVSYLHYYEVLAAVRVAILMQRAASLMILSGQISPSSTMATINPVTQMLAALLGLPSLDGTASSFIGNR